MPIPVEVDTSDFILSPMPGALISIAVVVGLAMHTQFHTRTQHAVNTFYFPATWGILNGGLCFRQSRSGI